MTFVSPLVDKQPEQRIVNRSGYAPDLPAPDSGTQAAIDGTARSAATCLVGGAKIVHVPEDELTCVRCQRPVVRNADRYQVFERVHWNCFHYVFEHELAGSSSDPDIACRDPGCPARAFDTKAPPEWLAET